MTNICIITALPAEARPFMNAFKLRHIDARGLRLYGNEHCMLLQTGVGKLKAAAATAALLHSKPEVSTIINAGIAGGTDAVGSVYMGHQIKDSATDEQWFPHLPPQRVTQRLPTASIHTIDAPSNRYTEGVLLDMEAAGIYSAAAAYLSTDAMHCIKVISDNTTNTTVELNADRVVELMHSALECISNLIEWCGNANHSSADDIGINRIYSAVESSIYHTVSEKHQLRRLLRQYNNLAGYNPALEDIIELETAKKIRHYLQAKISCIPFTYGN